MSKVSFSALRKKSRKMLGLAPLVSYLALRQAGMGEELIWVWRLLDGVSNSVSSASGSSDNFFNIEKKKRA